MGLVRAGAPDLVFGLASGPFAGNSAQGPHR